MNNKNVSNSIRSTAISSVTFQTFTCKCPMGKKLDESGRKCIDDVKPFLVIIQKTNVFGIEMNAAS